MREGRIAARLQHPNAITVYDVAEHEGDPWLIMEYLPSKSLATVLSEQGTLPATETARIGAQVASALVAAHAAGIVHRDIKPANVLLGDDGTVKITDFGISRATGDVTVTATGMLAGTPAYLAPEVAKGEDPKPAADVFSLGSTLYTAVEGHSPFGLSENTLALLYAVAAGKITPPRQAGPLTALLMQLLRVEPSERPSLTITRDGLLAVAEGRAPVGHMGGGPSDATERIAGSLLPPPRQHTPPRQWPAVPSKEGTRLDVRPFSEPPPSAPMMSAAMSSGMSSAMPPPPARTDNRMRSIVLTVLAIVAAALVGILVASLLTANSDDNGQTRPGETSQGTPVGNTLPATSTTTSAPTSTTTTTAEPAGPTDDDYAAAVRDYYGLLPGDVEAAWALMTPSAQDEGGGARAYERFWKGVRAVQVLSTSVDGDQVTATLRFVTKRNRMSTEDYTLTFVEEDGDLLIDHFEKDGRSSDGDGDN